jgi:hypothetical protein
MLKTAEAENTAPLNRKARRQQAAGVNACDVPEFCRRNCISISTAYKAKREGLLRIVKVYGKALVYAEDEAAWIKAARDGKLAKDKRKPRARAKALPAADAAAA